MKKMLELPCPLLRLNKEPITDLTGKFVEFDEEPHVLFRITQLLSCPYSDI